MSTQPTFQFQYCWPEKKKTKKNEWKKWDTDKQKKKEVREEFIKEVTANVRNTQLEEVEEINDIWIKTKKKE